MFELFSNTKAREKEQEKIQEMFNQSNNNKKDPKYHEVKSDGCIIRK